MSDDSVCQESGMIGDKEVVLSKLAKFTWGIDIIKHTSDDTTELVEGWVIGDEYKALALYDEKVTELEQDVINESAQQSMRGQVASLGKSLDKLYFDLRIARKHRKIWVETYAALREYADELEVKNQKLHDELDNIAHLIHYQENLKHQDKWLHQMIEAGLVVIAGGDDE